MAQRSLRDSTIYFKDYDDNSLAIVVGEGNLTWSEQQNVEYTLNAGKVAPSDGGRTRLGDEVPLELSIDATFEYYISAGSEAVTPVEVLYNEGAAAGWDLADPDDLCAPPSINIEVVYNPGSCGGASDPIETITFPKFRFDSIDFDVDAGTISISGKCQVTRPTVVRSSS